MKHLLKIENCLPSSRAGGQRKLKIVGRVGQAGFSTLEVLIAMVIIVMALTAIILVIFSNQTVTADVDINQYALNQARKQLEEAKETAVIDFSSLASSSGVIDIFNTSLSVKDINTCRKHLTSQVSWFSDPLRPGQVELETFAIDSDQAKALSGDCGPNDPPVSEWWHPDTFTSIDMSVLGGPNNGTSATSIDIFTKGGKTYAALSTKHNTQAVPDIWIVEVTDPNSVSLSDSYEVEDASEGLNHLDVAGNFSYSASHYDSKQLQVVDLTSLTGLNDASSKSLPGVGNSYPQGRKIFYYNNRIYIGVNETAGHEFHVFDVSNPYNPVHLGSIELTHNIHDIFVRDNYAYLATSDNTGELMVINISNPSAMIHPDVSGLKYNATGNHDGTALYVLGNKLYLGRRNGTSTAHNFLILNIENTGVPNGITLLGSKFIKRNPTQGLGITAMIVVDTFAFLGTDDTNAEFQVFRVTNPSNIYSCSETEFAGCGKYNFPAKITDIDFYGNYIYASVESNDAFRIIYDNLNQY